MELQGEHAADQALIAETIRLDAERGERLVAKLRTALHTSVVTGVTIIGQFLPLDPSLRPIKHYFPLFVPVVLIMSWGWLWFVHTRPYRRIYGVISVSADVLVLSGLVVATSIALGTPMANANLLGAAPALVGLFFVLAAAGVRQDPLLCVLSGALSLVAYGAAIWITRGYGDLGPLGALGFFGSVWIWLARGVVVAFTTALVALAARNARRMVESAGRALGERARLLQLFGRYVDPQVASGVLSRGAAAETREVTVLFTDLRGFTSLSERLSPVETLSVLNAHYGAIVPAVHQHGGTVNKFIGDAIMATFGAPLAQPDHALRAVRAAEAMLAAMDELNAGFRAAGRPVLEMGVGIATGQVVVGSLGDRSRVEYAIIGDTVNTASRLEAMNKELSTRVLMSAATRAAAGAGLSARSLGEMALRGKAQPVEVYTLAA